MTERRNGGVPVVLIVAFSIVFAVVLALLFSRGGNTSVFGSVKTVQIEGLQKIKTCSDGFACYDGTTVSYLSSTGSARWSYMVGTNADFAASEQGVAAWQGRTITVIDLKSGNTTFNGTMEQNVISAYVGEIYTAILIGEEETSAQLIIMENGGRQVNRILMEDEIAVDYGFFSGGSLLWIMVLDTNGTVPTCTIQTYRPGKEIVGSISDTSQLIYAVQFQSSRVLAAGDTYLKTYDYTGTEDVNARKLIYGWVLANVDKTSSDPMMVLVTDAQYSGASDIRDVRLIRGKSDRVVRMPFGCKEVLALGDTAYGFSTDGHVMVLGPDSNKAKAFQLSFYISDIYGITRDGVAVLGYGSTVYLLDLV